MDAMPMMSWLSDLAWLVLALVIVVAGLLAALIVTHNRTGGRR
jgi:hypothetical protein